MSEWYWIAWAVVTGVNAALYVASWRNLRDTLRLFEKGLR